MQDSAADGACERLPGVVGARHNDASPRGKVLDRPQQAPVYVSRHPLFEDDCCAGDYPALRGGPRFFGVLHYPPTI
jgi:hypothetical protein